MTSEEIDKIMESEFMRMTKKGRAAYNRFFRDRVKRKDSCWILPLLRYRNHLFKRAKLCVFGDQEIVAISITVRFLPNEIDTFSILKADATVVSCK